MFLTLPRERNITFPPVLPFTHHPGGKPRSPLPTEGRIIARFNPFTHANLPSSSALYPCSVLVMSFTQSTVHSPQSFTLSVFRLRTEGRSIEKASFPLLNRYFR